MAKEFVAVIDDGTREIPVKNKFGKLICNIYIRPADYAILDRQAALQKKFDEVSKKLANMDIKNDGSSEFDDDWAKMKEVENELKRAFDDFFGMEEADEIFKDRNPFSSVGGKFFCEIVMDAIGQIVEQAMEEELELSEARTQKYFDDLNKKKK